MTDEINEEAFALFLSGDRVYAAVYHDSPTEARGLLIQMRTRLGNLERLIAEEQQRRLDGEYE